MIEFLNGREEDREREEYREEESGSLVALTGGTPVPAESSEPESLVELAMRRMNEGYPPPAEIYMVQNRNKIDWSRVPRWARPVEPDVFDGCCHEG